MQHIFSRNRIAALAIASLGAASVAHAQVKPPAPGALRPYAFPKVEQFTLDNGLKVIVIEKHTVPVVEGRIILDAGCVVSAPLPALSGPPLARGHRSEGGGTFLSDPEGSPSAVRGLLAARAIHGGLFGVAAGGQADNPMPP